MSASEQRTERSRPPAALVEYVVLPDEVAVFAVSDGALDAVRVPVDRERLRSFVTGDIGGVAGGPARDFAADAWGEVLGPLVEPVTARIPAGTILWIVPHDVLHYVPFHAIPVGDGFLVDRNPTCYSASASVLRYCQANRRADRAGALVLADSLGDLAHAREEGHLVAERFATEPYVGPAATKAALVGGLAARRGGLGVVHLSCHGRFDSEHPLDSAVLLAPGDPDSALTAAEMLTLDLEGELVVLSACETGLSERRAGDELIGLTRALVVAGASSAIVSLWRVDDLSTALLMERLYAALAAEPAPTRAEALAAAQADVRDLTAAAVVARCDARLDELAAGGESERELRLMLDRAAAQALAGDIAGALAAYEELAPRLADDVAADVERTIELLRLKELAPPEVDYDARPFAHPYHWAPFLLYGDWR